MSEPIPVSLRDGRPWRPQKSLKQLCKVLVALTKSHPHEVTAGAIKPMRLDSRSRREDDNKLKMKPPKKNERDRSIQARFRFNKGLSMEMATAAVLAHFDHPREVRLNCKPSRRGLPNFCAGGGRADIEVYPSAVGYRIVCEVTSNRSIDPASLEGQLANTLKHAVQRDEEEPVPVSYGLLINHADVGRDKAFRTRYRDFVNQEENVADGVSPSGRYRLTSIYTTEFVALVRRLDGAGKLSFNSHRFARALDVLCERLLEDIKPAKTPEKTPEKTPKKKAKKDSDADWMAVAFYNTIIGRVIPKQEELF